MPYIKYTSDNSHGHRHWKKDDIGFVSNAIAKKIIAAGNATELSKEEAHKHSAHGNATITAKNVTSEHKQD